MSVWAIVPYKGAENAKRRLSSQLSAGARSRLVLAMLKDVLQALKAAVAVDGILLTSRAPEARQLARDLNITLFRDQAHTLVDALTEATVKAKRDLHASTTIIVPGDVPQISGTDVDHVLHYHADVTIVPDRNKVGTNALVCTPPDAIPLVFDGRSYHPHLDSATRLGLQVRSVQSDAFAVDVDTSEDLLRIHQNPMNTQTFQLLETDPELVELLKSLQRSDIRTNELVGEVRKQTN